MIDHPCKGLGLSFLARREFEKIANGHTGAISGKCRSELLKRGLIMRREIGIELVDWILTPAAWAQWAEYERQRAAEYIESEELQPAATVAIARKETA